MHPVSRRKDGTARSFLILLKRSTRRLLGLITGLLTTAIVLTAYTSWLRAFYKVETKEDEIHFVTTQDGWRLACSRYRPSEASERLPVLLCHGLGSNHTTFDMAAECSLARFLAEEGYDVWAIDLRGHGKSEIPSFFNDKRYGWSFDDYLLKDLPAAVEHILKETGQARFHWIGHSMGGVLLYATLSRLGGARIASGCAVASGLDYGRSSSRFGALDKWRWLVRPLPALPYGLFVLFVCPLAGRFGIPAERFLYWPENIHSGLCRKLLANNAHAISTSVLMQLSTALKPGGLRWKDDSVKYLDGLSQTNVPVLALVGDQDLQCPLEAAEIPIDALHATTQVLLFGPQEGHREHYGHFDLLLGRYAKEEVFPHILSWLRSHDREA